jgi:cytochrome c-type biogenesis protein CcmH/NrfG
LYSAGTAATASGDYESAYTAYQASYEMSPNPDALLASGKALEQMARDTLRESESSS